MYQVLARKWRPRNFKEMVGQDHVRRVLVNALESQRLHHAYLFTGTRGVGKTTIARIFAKSLNCTQHDGVTAEPCGECPSCKEINDGRFVDLIEVDAASRTRVDETRELLDNVQYAPTRGRYKVYLIDEVHMLSTSSFNALLKTLEEPPPHVKFLLATTDPQKLPATVLSRCLQFNLKRMLPAQISAHLQNILDQEQIDYEFSAFALLAKAADGSMRDALSLLDQAIAFGGGKLLSNETATMLGTLEHDVAPDLLSALADNDGAGLLARSAQLAEHSPDYVNLLADLLSLLQRIALAQVVPETLDNTQTDHQAVLGLCNRLSPQDVQLFYQIGLLGRRDLPLAPEPRGGFEMVLLRMLAFRPAPSNGSAITAPTATPAAPPPKMASSPPSQLAPPTTPPSTSPTARSSVALDDWSGLVQNMQLNGAVRMLAENCVLRKREGDTFYLVLAMAQSSFKNYQQRLQQALETYLGQNIKLVLTLEEATQDDTPAVIHQKAAQIRHQDALARLREDSLLCELQATFDAQLDEASVCFND